ncbi:MAG: YggS family pyridoxal phosphate-dependent enzyme [bacterium]
MIVGNDLIKQQVEGVLQKLPKDVLLVAAAKTRTPDEIKAAVKAGVKVIGYNYVQEAKRMYDIIGNRVQWHMIGHLQRNKAKQAVTLFDMIETVDNLRLAEALNRCCAESSKTMPILIEINSGREENKSGVFTEKVEELVSGIAHFENIRVQGLMTMGPLLGDPENSRPYFRATKETFDRLKESNIPNVEMRYLSMGMSRTYQIAIQEGANIVRIGTKLFGERHYK